MTPTPTPPAQPSASITRTYLRRSVPALFSVFLIAGCAAWLTFQHLAGVLDQEILDHSYFLARKALDQHRRTFMKDVAADAALANAYRGRHSEAAASWAAALGTVTEVALLRRQHDWLQVIGAQGEVLYTAKAGAPVQADTDAQLPGDIPSLVSQANVGGAGGAVAYTQAQGQPVMVAAQYLGAANGGGPVAILLVADLMTQDELTRLGLDFSLSEFHYVSAPPADGEPTLGLRADDGSELLFSWYPPSFGGELLGDLGPQIGIAGAVVLALLALIIHDALRGAKALERSYGELAASQQDLATSEARFRDIAEAASDWLWETDLELRLIYLSERFSTITGHAAHDLLGRPLDELLRPQHPAPLGEALRLADAQPVVCYYRSAQGRERVCRLASRPVKSAGQVVGYRGTASDITEELEAQAKVLHMSEHDALTGLPNRNRLKNFLEGRLLRRQPVVLLSLDLDRFKAVNDTLGHAAGDSVLQEVARRLSECVREEDLVARLGGDEFILVLDSALAQPHIEELCARIITQLEQPFFYEEQQIFIGTSIGVALSPLDASDADELLRCGDVALYQAKADGRATWRFYASDMNHRLIHRRQLELDLRHALANQQFQVHYQPRYRLDEMTMTGAEALVRWQHPQRGLLLPEEFLPLAEETGLIVTLGEWVLGEACRTAMRWPASLLVSVNLSSVQFSHGVLEVVSQALRESGLPAARLELEVTESVLLEDAGGALRTLTALKALGVRLTMDDFGTGYSSLNYLRSYPFDGLKIDRSFIATLNESDSDRSIVQAVVSLAHALDMTVTAEGVETPEQLWALRQEDCAEAQGFHLSRPQPAGQMLALIERTFAPSEGNGPE